MEPILISTDATKTTHFRLELFLIKIKGGYRNYFAHCS